MLTIQWQQIVISDLRKVIREPFFWFIMTAPLFVAMLVHELLPWLASRFPDIDLAFYYPLILVILVLTPPLYYGMVLGLQILDEKDENVLLAVAVTPLQLHTYLAARIAIYSLVSIPLIILVHEMIGVLELEMAKLFWVAIAVSLNTPLLTLLLAALAKNQLEGFVMIKGLGFIIIFPVVMFFVPDYWHVLCGILPTYWPIIAYYTAAESGSDVFFYVAILMAVITQLIASVLLYRKFASGLLAT